VRLATLDGTEVRLHSDVVQATFKEQHLFFKDLDAAIESVRDPSIVERFEEQYDRDMVRDADTGWMTPFLTDFDAATTTQPTTTIVMEAAFYLIKSTLLHIPRTGCINVKQALTLLHYARWIQCSKTVEWEDAGVLSPVRDRSPLAYQLRLILIGAAGTGKSTKLRKWKLLRTNSSDPLLLGKVPLEYSGTCVGRRHHSCALQAAISWGIPYKKSRGTSLRSCNESAQKKVAHSKVIISAGFSCVFRIETLVRF
jgi:hypothetical protein